MALLYARNHIPYEGIGTLYSGADCHAVRSWASVPDRPASIVDLAAIAASQQANILDIHHGRTFTSAAFRETEIELMVETRGPEAVEALLRTMAAKGYQAQPFKFE
jgi:hypothetical protein